MNIKNKSHGLFRHVIPLNENIIRVSYSDTQETPKPSILIADDFAPDSTSAANHYEIREDSIIFKNKNGETVLRETEHGLTQKDIYRYIIDGEPIVKHKLTANGEVSYIENSRREPNGSAYEGKLVFEITEDEGIYGLGQHEDGIYNYNGKKEYLYQTNMKISIPFLISSNNYGILIDTESAVIFDSVNGRLSFLLDTVTELSYYVIVGKSFDEIISELRSLTGNVPMLPRWVFGYVQSKERYDSSNELLRTVSEFRSLGIPIDCIVQDWQTWEKGLWGEKTVDKIRYPNLPELVGSLHKQHVKLMVSIWPNMAEGSSNLREFKEKDQLLPNSTTYNAFDEDARIVYWKQCETDWFSADIDAWWCDNSEPFSDADWNGEIKRPENLRYQLIVEDSKKSMDWTRLNTYGLMHSKGIYDNWRKSGNPKRVVNLTRSSYISGQKYGVIAWSGDISAKWSTLKKQIAEGIKFSMSGMPYWTLDIGGFFTVKDKWENRGCGNAGNSTPLWFWDGDYNDGVNDLGYKELYLRWLQYAAFLPIFRAHGTDTPREPWNLGKEGDIFYDAILKFIRLRYRLLPYIYSCAAAVSQNNDTLLRSLMFDFAVDKNVMEICDSYMFGKSLLVCPVTEPMYYAPNSVPLKNTDKIKTVYLPKSSRWIDFWTNKAYDGGQTISCDAPLDRIPLFVKAGAILPVSDPIAYADERSGHVSEILVYSGADSEFTLYNDEGDNYSYENGNFSAIPMMYKDDQKTLTFGKVRGSFHYQKNFRVKFISDSESTSTVDVRYEGEETISSLV